MQKSMLMHLHHLNRTTAIQYLIDAGGWDSLRSLQLIQNVAPRVLTGIGKEDIARWLLSLAACKKNPGFKIVSSDPYGPQRPKRYHISRS